MGVLVGQIMPEVMAPIPPSTTSQLQAAAAELHRMVVMGAVVAAPTVQDQRAAPVLPEKSTQLQCFFLSLLYQQRSA